MSISTVLGSSANIRASICGSAGVALLLSCTFVDRFDLSVLTRADKDNVTQGRVEQTWVCDAS